MATAPIATQSPGVVVIPGWITWTGRIITLLVAIAFGMSASMKFKGGEAAAKMMTDLGVSASSVLTLGIIETTCLVLYLVPQTAVLGAILLTGYLGGATLAHARVDQMPTAQVIIGVLVWLGIFFRDYRLRQLIPLRKGTGTPV